MLTSIATVSISGNLDTKLRAIAEAGFDGVEIFENDLLTSTADRARCRCSACAISVSTARFSSLFATSRECRISCGRESSTASNASSI